MTSQYFNPSESEFYAYPKTPRLSGMEMTITEKIDGTNAQVTVKNGQVVGIGSRKRAILPDIDALRDEHGRRIRDENGHPVRPKACRDNMGFAAWVEKNAEFLVDFLGEGTHYGEWAGPGIQRNPLGLEEKRWYLFNTHRHPDEKFQAKLSELPGDGRPEVWHVPVLYKGQFEYEVALRYLSLLQNTGSYAYGCSSGAKAEGIVVSCFGHKFKLTPDSRPKGARVEQTSSA